MHSCPDCGQACCCGGDFEDHENEDLADACVHLCAEDEPFDELDGYPQEVGNNEIRNYVTLVRINPV